MPADPAPLPDLSEKPWIAEVFTDEWGTCWVPQGGRCKTADEALAVVEKYDGPFEHEPTVTVVTGRVEMRDDEPWFTEDVDGDVTCWRVSA